MVDVDVRAAGIAPVGRAAEVVVPESLVEQWEYAKVLRGQKIEVPRKRQLRGVDRVPDVVQVVTEIGLVDEDLGFERCKSPPCREARLENPGSRNACTDDPVVVLDLSKHRRIAPGSRREGVAHREDRR